MAEYTNISQWPGGHGGYVATRVGDNVYGPMASGPILACIEGNYVYFGTFPHKEPDLVVNDDGGVYAAGRRIFTVEGNSIRDGYNGHYFLTASQDDPMALAAAAGIHVGDYRLRTQHDAMVTMDDIPNEAALWADKWDRFGDRSGQRDHNRLDPNPPPGIKGRPYGDDFLENQRLSQMPIERGAEPWGDAEGLGSEPVVSEDWRDSYCGESGDLTDEELNAFADLSPEEREALHRKWRAQENGTGVAVVVGVIAFILWAMSL